MPEFNASLADRIVGQIIAEPRTWDQMSYGREDTVCGAAFCVAGWAAVMSGQAEYVTRLVEDIAPDHFARIGCDCSDCIPIGREDRQFFAPGTGTVVSAFATGRDALGLTDPQAETLFHAGNKLVDIRRMFKNLANGDDISADA